MRGLVIAAVACSWCTACSWIYDPDKLPAVNDGSVDVDRPDGPGSDGADTGPPLTQFAYSPSNFDPTDVRSTRNVVVDCAMTFDSSAPTFTAACAGQSVPDVRVRDQVSGGPEVVVLSMASLIIEEGGSITFTGSRPVIFAVYGDAVIGGPIDGRADLHVPGVGARPACSPGAGDPGGDTTDGAAGGGAGGTNGEVGKDGGAGALGGEAGGLATATPLGNPELTPLYGGCGGGKGGSSNTGVGGVAGAGGGAIQISVAGSLTVQSWISVSGGGGRGGDDSDGGGGAGSGGNLLVEAGTVFLAPAQGALTSNGGAGGEGGSNNSGCDDPPPVGCDNGDNGSADSTTPAVGGDGDSASSGAGGDGGTVTNTATKGLNGVSGSGAGGGGGAGVGYIRVNAASVCTLTNAVVSGKFSAGNAACAE